MESHLNSFFPSFRLLRIFEGSDDNRRSVFLGSLDRANRNPAAAHAGVHSIDHGSLIHRTAAAELRARSEIGTERAHHRTRSRVAKRSSH